MTKEELADQLNGNEYRSEYTKEQMKLAKENSLVIVHGASDDLIEFEGGISDEYGSFEGGSVRITKKHNIKEAKPDSENVIHGFWCPKNDEGKVIASWVFSTDIPHSTFKIMEDDEVYCIGLVFSLSDLK